jgi:hypothetical protein
VTQACLDAAFVEQGGGAVSVPVRALPPVHVKGKELPLTVYAIERPMVEPLADFADQPTERRPPMASGLDAATLPGRIPVVPGAAPRMPPPPPPPPPAIPPPPLAGTVPEAPSAIPPPPSGRAPLAGPSLRRPPDKPQ